VAEQTLTCDEDCNHTRAELLDMLGRPVSQVMHEQSFCQSYRRKYLVTIMLASTFSAARPVQRPHLLGLSSVSAGTVPPTDLTKGAKLRQNLFRTCNFAQFTAECVEWPSSALTTRSRCGSTFPQPGRQGCQKSNKMQSTERCSVVLSPK